MNKPIVGLLDWAATLAPQPVNAATGTRGPMSHRRAPRTPLAKRRVAIENSMMTFVVRLTRDKVGHVTGVVEQVRTGLKVRVEGLDAVGRAIGEMIAPPAPDQIQDTPGARDS
jgi:hypothetical protein